MQSVLTTRPVRRMLQKFLLTYFVSAFTVPYICHELWLMIGWCLLGHVNALVFVVFKLSV